jgi:Flp pilus assembly protein CpaB
MKNKNIIIILLAVLVLGSGAVGFLVWQRREQKQRTGIENMSVEEAPTKEDLEPIGIAEQNIQEVGADISQGDIIDISSTDTVISDPTKKTGANDQKIRGGVL